MSSNVLDISKYSPTWSGPFTPHSPCRWVPLVPQSCQYLVTLDILIFANLAGVKWYLAVLVCNSLINIFSEINWLKGVSVRLVPSTFLLWQTANHPSRCVKKLRFTSRMPLQVFTPASPLRCSSALALPVSLPDIQPHTGLGASLCPIHLPLPEHPLHCTVIV